MERILKNAKHEKKSVRKFKMGTHSFRNFDIENQFGKQFKECKKKGKDQWKCEVEVRRRYREVESGRLSQMGDKIHNFFIPLDRDERETFKKKFPEMVNVGNEFAVVEELMEIK